MDDDRIVEIINCVDENPEEESADPYLIQPPPKLMNYEPPQEEIEDTGVLDADHPLLERFQRALNEHLTRVRDQLLEDILNLDGKLRLKEKRREEIGAKVYDLQAEIHRQNNQLDDLGQKIQDTIDKRQETDDIYGPLRKNHEDKIFETKQAKRHYNERLMELTRLKDLQNNIKLWCDQINDEVSNAKRIVNRDAQLQQQMSEQKRQMDFILFNIESEIRRCEQDLKAINLQIDEEKDNINLLSNSFSDAQADLEALQQEQKRISASWGQVIRLIEKRDAVYYKVKSELNEKRENVTLTIAAIEGTKKSAKNQMKTNEEFDSFRMRMESDFNNTSKQMDKETLRSTNLERKYGKLKAVYDQTQNDYNAALQDENVLKTQLREIQKKLDKQIERKLMLEDDILKLAQEQLSTDKATTYRLKKLRETQDQRRHLEINFSQTELNLSNTLLDLEKWKEAVVKAKEENERIQRSFDVVNDEANNMSQTIKDLLQSTGLKVKLIEQLNAKIELLERCAERSVSSSPQAKILELERRIQDYENQIRELKKFWLIMEGVMIDMTEKRGDQTKEMQVLQKQLMIINQKSVKVDREVAQIEAFGREIAKNVNAMILKFDMLNAKLYEKKKTQQNEEGHCEMIHIELLERLKNSEISVLELEEEIADLNRDIENYKECVLEKHRESLSWETKYKMIEEILRWRKNEQAMESEIGNMRQEIHRMEVRHLQLKRAQEKLIQDLEQCVMHRDHIFDEANLRRKRDGSDSKSRANIQHKLNDLKNKLKSTLSEISKLEKKMSIVTGEYEYIMNDISKKEKDVEEQHVQDNLILKDIEQETLMKYMNLDNIIRRQNRAKKYRGLSCISQMPKIGKSESVQDANIRKQKEINENLVSVAQLLLDSYPDKKFALTRILNTCKQD